MTTTIKLLAVTIPIVGGGIAIPLYLKSTGESVTKKAQNSVQASPESVRPAEKVECKVSEVPQSNPNSLDFLNKKSKKEGDYIYVTCNNTDIKGDRSSLLDKDWTGLFLKDVLNEIFSPEGTDNFPMSVEISQEEGTGGSWNKSVFRNPKTQAFIEGKWGDFENTDFGKKSVPVSIQGGTSKRGDIYIFTGKADTDTNH